MINATAPQQYANALHQKQEGAPHKKKAILTYLSYDRT
jgi:hypothetical protein